MWRLKLRFHLALPIRRRGTTYQLGCVRAHFQIPSEVALIGMSTGIEVSRKRLPPTSNRFCRIAKQILIIDGGLAREPSLRSTCQPQREARHTLRSSAVTLVVTRIGAPPMADEIRARRRDHVDQKSELKQKIAARIWDAPAQADCHTAAAIVKGMGELCRCLSGLGHQRYPQPYPQPMVRLCE